MRTATVSPIIFIPKRLTHHPPLIVFFFADFFVHLLSLLNQPHVLHKTKTKNKTKKEGASFQLSIEVISAEAKRVL